MSRMSRAVLLLAPLIVLLVVVGLIVAVTRGGDGLDGDGIVAGDDDDAAGETGTLEPTVPGDDGVVVPSPPLPTVEPQVTASPTIAPEVTASPTIAPTATPTDAVVGPPPPGPAAGTGVEPGAAPAPRDVAAADTRDAQATGAMPATGGGALVAGLAVLAAARLARRRS